MPRARAPVIRAPVFRLFRLLSGGSGDLHLLSISPRCPLPPSRNRCRAGKKAAPWKNRLFAARCPSRIDPRTSSSFPKEGGGEHRGRSFSELDTNAGVFATLRRRRRRRAAAWLSRKEGTTVQSTPPPLPPTLTAAAADSRAGFSAAVRSPRVMKTRL